MLKLLVAASGSKANSTVIIYQNDVIIIDCGTTYKALSDALLTEGLTPKNISAVFVTHSHSDHVKGLATLKNKISAPFYSAVDIEGCNKMRAPVTVGSMAVSYFECCHDVDCVGYKITAGNKSVAVATDTGRVTECMLSQFVNCDAVMLECNHDVNMLKAGPYPAALKSRILSDNGHLSNTDCAKVITYLASNGTKKAVLAHISETNNTPLVARSEVLLGLKNYGLEKQIEVVCAEPLTQIEI